MLGSATVYVKKVVQSLLWLQREINARNLIKLPQVMSLESALIGIEDYEFENLKKIVGGWVVLWVM